MASLHLHVGVDILVCTVLRLLPYMEMDIRDVGQAAVYCTHSTSIPT